MEGEDFMATEEVVHQGNLAAGDERRAESRQEACERITFGLALALATEPSKLGQLRVLPRIRGKLFHSVECGMC
jgi:hypothetical protein